MHNKKLLSYDATAHVPEHIAIIMDGNGRWAKQYNKKRTEGHLKGLKAVRTSIEFAVNNQLKCLSLYAFSKENWKRDQREVNFLLNLFIRVLDKYYKFISKFNVRLCIIGDILDLPQNLQQKIYKMEEKSKNNTGLLLNVAINYSGKWDIIQAAQKISKNNIEFNEDNFKKYLTVEEYPEIDLLIRTGGDQRISNFFLWQAAYSELVFFEEYWPDFNAELFSHAIATFQQRERRFGGILNKEEIL